MSPAHLTLAHRHANQAIMLAIIAYACYSTGDALVKLLGSAHGKGLIMTCNGLLICGLSLAFLAAKRQAPALWQTKHIKLHLTRSCIVGALVFLALTALQHVPLHDFYGILFMSPFVVGLFAHFLLKEEIGPHRIVTIIVGFIGVTILAGPSFTHLNIGYIFVVIMLFVSAGHVLLVRKLGTADPWPLLAFFPGFGMLIVGLPMLIAHPEWPRLDTIPLLVIYAVCILGGQVAFSKAFTITPLMAIIAPYMYTQMLWGVMYSAILFHEYPTTTTVIGAGIVIASGVGNLLYERHLRRLHLLGAAVHRGEPSPSVPPPPPPVKSVA